MSQIAIFGGAFDPPHMGHQKIVETVSGLDEIDNVYIVPTFISPHKDTTRTDLIHRISMLRDFVNHNDKCELSLVEIERKGVSYTIDTVYTFKQRFPDDDLYIVIGADNYFILHTWHQYYKVIDNCKFIVINRNLTNIYRYQEYHDKYFSDIDLDKFYFVQMAPVNVASQEIRRLARDGKSIKSFVPDYIEEYIKKNKLYK